MHVFVCRHIVKFLEKANICERSRNTWLIVWLSLTTAQPGRVMPSSAPVTAQGMFLPSTACAKKPRVTFAPNIQPVELKGPNHLPSKNNPISGRKGCDSTSNTPSVPNAVTITASNDMTNSHLITWEKFGNLEKKVEIWKNL